MKIAMIIGGIWIVGVLFYLALFKAAARGDRMLEEFYEESEDEKEGNIF
ncbi:MAG: hypothetical protein ACRCWM_11330 [Sarcina sp.]